MPEINSISANVSLPALTGGLVENSNSLSPFLNRVLVTADLSATTANILGYAVLFCQKFRAGLSVAHVIHPDAYPFQLPETWPQLAEAEIEICQKFENLVGTSVGTMPHETILEKGEVWPTIRRIIHDKKIDLLIAGTHGRSGISKTLIGSIAEQMLMCASCPLLTIGPNVSISGSRSLRLNRILYATDFSAESLSAVSLVISMCKASGAELTLLHCHTNGEVAAVMLESLRDVIPLGAGLNTPPDCFVRTSPHRYAILELAKEQSADLIVLGIPRKKWHSKLATHFTDATVYHIVSQAECPVLTVRK